MESTIGASEMYSLLTNKNQIIRSKISLINDKKNGIKMKNLNNVIACSWGTLFEGIIMDFVQINLDNKIYGDDICIRKYKGIRISPDGYIIIKQDNNIFHQLDNNKTDLIALLEFKCPITRKPTMEIPKQYEPQVQAGLAVSEMAGIGLFVDSVFRICKLQDLGFNNLYNKAYHKVCNYITEPIAYGMVAVYSPCFDAPLELRYFDGNDISRNAYGLLNYNKLKMGDILDLSGDDYLFNNVLGYITSNRYKINKYMNCNVLDNKSNKKIINEFKINTPKNYYMFGIISWKLFETTYIPIIRRPNFINEIIPLVDEVFNEINKINETSIF